MTRRGRPWLFAAAVCAGLAIAHTWPLATAPGTLCRNDNGDAQLNEWILAWIAHQLPRAPAHLFDANIFYPARNTLAFSEPLIVPGIMGAPLHWLGASPVLVYNVVLILGFTLTAWATFTLVYEWTRDRSAALLAASVFAFNTHTLTRLTHVQGIHAWGLPLALLSTDRLIVSGRLRDAVWLAVWMTAMAYTSGYLAVFGVVMIGVSLLARVRSWLPRAGTVCARFGVAAALTVVATLPLFLHYRRAAIEEGMVRFLESVSLYSVGPRAYLASAGRVHLNTWSGEFFKTSIDYFFPGFVALILTGVAIAYAARPIRASDDQALARDRALMLVAIAVTGFVLSLGTNTPVYSWLFHVFPPLQGLRAASRFGNLFLLAVALLAGLGLSLLRQRGHWFRSSLAGVALVVAVNAESLRAPLHYTRFAGIPNIYANLADEPGRVVLVEIPFYPIRVVFENATYVLNSTAHWRPIMNGYSGYTPDRYRLYADAFAPFPSPGAIEAMKQAGATHVMVHPERLWMDRAAADDFMAQLATNPDLERISIGQQGVTLYRLR
jgi:hypothetical protein